MTEPHIRKPYQKAIGTNDHAYQVRAATRGDSLFSQYFHLSAAAGILESDENIYDVFGSAMYQGVAVFEGFRKDALLAGRDAALPLLREAKGYRILKGTAYCQLDKYIAQAIHDLETNRAYDDKDRLRALAAVNAARAILSVVMEQKLAPKAA